MFKETFPIMGTLARNDLRQSQRGARTSATQLGAHVLVTVQRVSGGQLNDPHRSPQLDGAIQLGSFPEQPPPNTRAHQSPNMIDLRERRAPS
jgi:hypothetical protein